MYYNKALRRTFWVLLPLLIPAAVFSQQVAEDYIVSTRKYSVEEGLASREVFCALQDKEGFMWFGTRNGLNRFDGSRFKVFSSRTHGLMHNKIVHIALDLHGRMILHYGHNARPRAIMGIEILDPLTQEIIPIAKALPGLPVPAGNVYWISNQDSLLAMISIRPLQYWHYSGGKFSLIASPATPTSHSDRPLNDNVVPLFCGKRAILPSPDFSVWVSAEGSTRLAWDEIVRFTADGNVLVRHKFSGSGKLSPTGKFIPMGPLPYLFNQTAVRADGNTRDRLEYTDSQGLFLLTDTSRIEILSPGVMNISNTIGAYSFFKDRQSHYWICTSDGLYKTSVQPSKFNKYFTRDALPAKKQNQARGITLSPDGTLYTHLWSDLYKQAPGKEPELYYTYPKIGYALLSHRDKILADGSGLAMFSAASRNKPVYLLKDENTDIWSMLAISDTSVLLGTGNGVLLVHFPSQRVDTFRAVGYDMPLPETVYRFVYKTNNTYWTVAQNGIFLTDLSSGTLRSYWVALPAQSVFKVPLQGNLHDAAADGAGGLWLATAGNGLWHWQPENGKVLRYTVADGLPSDMLYRIEPDRFGRLWISTDNGLSCFDPKLKVFEHYTTQQGLSHNEFNRISSFSAPDGRLFFGGLNGVISFYPEAFTLSPNPAIDPLKITAFNQFSGKHNRLEDKQTDLQQTGIIRLEPGDKFFTLEFELLDYREGKKNYAYRIDGIDKQWNPLPGNALRISGLSAGRVILRIRGQNADGKWSSSELEFPVEVLAPIWQRTWFIIMAIIIFLAIGLGVLRWRTRQLRHSQQALERTVAKRTEQLKELLDQKDLMMKEIHHRVKNNLQVISGLLELQKARTHDETTRSALEESQNRVLSIAFLHQNLYQHDDLKGVQMERFIRELTAHIGDVLQSPSCTVTIEQAIEPVMLDIETALPLGLMLNELLTNSFKYAFVKMKTGQINLTLSSTGEGSYRFAYSDNGAGQEGVNLSAQTGSLGTRLIHQLSRQLDGKMSYYYAEGVNFTLDFYNLEMRTLHEK